MLGASCSTTGDVVTEGALAFGASATGAAGAGVVTGAGPVTVVSTNDSRVSVPGCSIVSVMVETSDEDSSDFFFAGRRAVRGFVATSTGAAVSTAVDTPPSPWLNHSRTVSASPRLNTLMWLGTFSARPSSRHFARIDLLSTPNSLAS